jgi:hypothetical protein
LASSHAEVMSGRGDVERLASDLAQDLAVVSGLPSEIATCWRRALVSIRDLPADRPLRLQDAVCQTAGSLRLIRSCRRFAAESDAADSRWSPHARPGCRCGRGAVAEVLQRGFAVILV